MATEGVVQQPLFACVCGVCINKLWQQVIVGVGQLSQNPTAGLHLFTGC